MFKQAAELGNALAQHRLGLIYLNGEFDIEKSIEKALEWFSLSFRQGCSISALKFGEFYEKGIGVEKFDKLTFFFYQLAYEKEIKEGGTEATFNLARCYELGIGVSQSLREAHRLYEHALNGGHPDAAEKLTEVIHQRANPHKKNK